MPEKPSDSTSKLMLLGVFFVVTIFFGASQFVIIPGATSRTSIPLAAVNIVIAFLIGFILNQGLKNRLKKPSEHAKIGVIGSLGITAIMVFQKYKVEMLKNMEQLISTISHVPGQTHFYNKPIIMFVASLTAFTIPFLYSYSRKAERTSYKLLASYIIPLGAYLVPWLLINYLV
ncbi:MAG: hypothetical protein MUP58_03205 [Candidatus Nanohaloarchaeota archaeon QJJ-9]|nr:hypothetical protein [Candidatus Nanohaloarchaeota archaeon QJJ-9]